VVDIAPACCRHHSNACASSACGLLRPSSRHSASGQSLAHYTRREYSVVHTEQNGNGSGNGGDVLSTTAHPPLISHKIMACRDSSVQTQCKTGEAQMKRPVQSSSTNLSQATSHMQTCSKHYMSHRLVQPRPFPAVHERTEQARSAPRLPQRFIMTHQLTPA
jgi:hypothetical protein